MSDDDGFWSAIGLALLFVLFLVMIFAAGLDVGRRDGKRLRQEAVERGFARYNPTNGSWEWKEERK